MEWFGLVTASGSVQVEWDSAENLQKTRESVAFPTHGCGCKTGCVLQPGANVSNLDSSVVQDAHALGA